MSNDPLKILCTHERIEALYYDPPLPNMEGAQRRNQIIHEHRMKRLKAVLRHQEVWCPRTTREIVALLGGALEQMTFGSYTEEEKKDWLKGLETLLESIPKDKDDPKPEYHIIPSPRPETLASEDAVLLRGYRAALREIVDLLKLPGSPNLITDSVKGVSDLLMVHEAVAAERDILVTKIANLASQTHAMCPETFEQSQLPKDEPKKVEFVERECKRSWTGRHRWTRDYGGYTACYIACIDCGVRKEKA